MTTTNSLLLDAYNAAARTMNATSDAVRKAEDALRFAKRAHDQAETTYNLTVALMKEANPS